MAINEKLDISDFQVGNPYSRVDIARVGRVKTPVGSRDPLWSKGIVPFAHAVVLLVTLDKANKADYAYEDRFEGALFWWQSQNQQTQQSPDIRRIAGGTVSVLLFARIQEKHKGRTIPFVYCGRLGTPTMESERPVTVLFECLDYQSTAGGNLRAIYEWQPHKVPTKDEASREATVRRRSGRSGRGQGRESDPRVRRAVELRAMVVAREHYERLGFAVTDTSSNRPYDFLVSKSGETRRVEVKGAQGGGASVTVTAGEVEAARAGPEATDLFIVSGIQVTDVAGTVECSGGVARILVGWKPLARDLVPTEYRYGLPAE